MKKVNGAKCCTCTGTGTSSVHSTSAGQQLLDLRVHGYISTEAVLDYEPLPSKKENKYMHMK